MFIIFPQNPVWIIKVFGNMLFNADTDYNRHNHFQTFLAGLLVLFRWVDQEIGIIK